MEDSKGYLAYEYYRTHEVTKQAASLEYGSKSLVTTFMKRHNIVVKLENPFKLNLSKGYLAYDYYMRKDSISKSDASLRYGNRCLVNVYMKRYNLPDKEEPGTGKSAKAYRWYMANPKISKRKASRKFGSETLVGVHIYTYGLPDKVSGSRCLRATKEYMADTTGKTVKYISLKYGSHGLITAYKKYYGIPKKDVYIHYMGIYAANRNRCLEQICQEFNLDIKVLKACVNLATK
ncbi:MAG: hypothetical protein ACRC0G_07155 [Fusobacteriaceae bacterium]